MGISAEKWSAYANQNDLNRAGRGGRPAGGELAFEHGGLPGRSGTNAGALRGLGSGGLYGPFYAAAGFFFPVAVLALAGGLLFGLWYGSLYTFLGAMCNCALMFLLARSVGRRRVERLIQTRLSPVWQDRLAQIGGRKGFLLLVVLRLIPAVPYNLINYAFGLSGMPLGTYMAASAIGIIPGTLAFINIGDKAMDAGSPGFWIAIGLLVLLLVVTTLLGKKLFPGPGKKEKGA